MRPEDRLAELGITLPTLSEPRGHYVRARRIGGTLYLAGHGPPPDAAGRRPTGRLGAEYDVHAGYDLSRMAGLALLATLREELGELSAVTAVAHVFGMVNVAGGFDATPAVIDGCSDLFVDVFGPAIGAHTRSAIGVAMLPYGMPVEIEAIVAVREPA